MEKTDAGFRLTAAMTTFLYPVVKNVSLADCVKFAYGLTSDFQLAGPEWITSKEFRYDIVAKTAPGTTREQALQMMRTLLAERFKLVVKEETKPMPSYALTVGKNIQKPTPTRMFIA